MYTVNHASILQCNIVVNLAVCHAEVNAILNKNSQDIKGCTIYVALFPCNECAKVIIQSGITKVKYMSDKHAGKIQTKAAKIMFKAAGVECKYDTRIFT